MDCWKVKVPVVVKPEKEHNIIMKLQKEPNMYVSMCWGHIFVFIFANPTAVQTDLLMISCI